MSELEEKKQDDDVQVISPDSSDDIDSLDEFHYKPQDIDLLANPVEFDDSFSSKLKKFKYLFKRNPNTKDDLIATKLSVFEDPDPTIARQYYPPKKYENYGSFDPYYRWTFKEDRRILKKIDWRIFTMVCSLFFALNLDRGNLSSAVAGGMLDDLKLNTDDYNLGNTLRSVGFIISEIPSQMIGKRFGPDWWIPLQVTTWSFVALFQFFMNDKKSYLALRFLLGITQGGFIADSVQYLSYFYTRDQISFRLSLFWLTDAGSGVISSLLSIGFLNINLHGKEGWRWLFLFDGIITLALGIASFFFMVPGPTQTRTRWNKTGIFTEHEEKVITNRLLRDDPSKSDMHNREGISFREFMKTLGDYDLWPLLILSFMFEIPQTPIKAYLNINLKKLKFGRDEIIYLNIPLNVFIMITIVAITLLSEFLNERALVSSLQQIWILVVVIVEYTSVAKISPWGQYALMFFAIGNPSAQAIIVSWCSRLSYSVRARAISSPMSNIGIQLCMIAAAQIYRKDDAPHYYRGNRNIIIVLCINILLFVMTKVYYISRNRYKRNKWNAMNDQEKKVYLSEHADDGNKRYDYLFEH